MRPRIIRSGRVLFSDTGRPGEPSHWIDDGVTPQYSLHVVGNGVTDSAIYAYNPTTTEFNAGVWGESESTSGRGVYGRASSGSGTTYGVQGTTSVPLAVACLVGPIA